MTTEEEKLASLIASIKDVLNKSGVSRLELAGLLAFLLQDLLTR
jgi:hypothetical protein